MTINISTHKTILFQILKDIYSNTKISPFLGFKGGTAALMFYNLDRFSVDIDLDLLDDTKEDLVFDEVIKIVKKYGTLKDEHKKRFNLFCLISYEDKSQNIKVEISRRHSESKYEIKTYLGVSMQVMILPDMVANKLMAMHERIGKTSRDIYDVWFFLSHRFPINRQLIENRSGTSFDQFINKSVSQLEKIGNNHILDGLGELLTPSQKDWAKAKLKIETISLLKLLSSTSEPSQIGH